MRSILLTIFSLSILYCGRTLPSTETNVFLALSRILDQSPLDPQTTCKTWKDQLNSASDGIYQIQPNPNNPAFSAYCDMTTDGGGWTLLLNRNVKSDNIGQIPLNQYSGTFDNSRAVNWQFDITEFWSGTTEVVFADKQNNSCANCNINAHDSAIKVTKPNIAAWSDDCPSTSSAVSVRKLVGPSAGTTGTAYTCASTLGWGDCSGKVCHYGVFHNNTQTDGAWASNVWNEMHFPSVNTSYASYGDVNAAEGSTYCRSCAGGLAASVNGSSTCCSDNSLHARAFWTIWVR